MTFGWEVTSSGSWASLRRRRMVAIFNSSQAATRSDSMVQVTRRLCRGKLLVKILPFSTYYRHCIVLVTNGWKDLAFEAKKKGLVSSLCQACTLCSVFERAMTPRHFLLGKGHPMRKLYISIVAFQGHQGNDQGAWKQSLTSKWKYKDVICGI